MMLDYIKGMIFSPSKTLREVIKKDLLVNSFEIFFASSIIYFLGLVIGGDVTSAFIIFALSAVSWIIGSAIVSWFALQLGGKGNFRKTLIAFGFAEVPLIFISIIFLIEAIIIFPVEIGTFIIEPEEPLVWVYSIITIVFSVWYIVLAVLGIREAHGLSTGKAIWALVLPYIIIFFCVTVMGTLAWLSISLI